MKNSRTSGEGVPAGGKHPKKISTSDERLLIGAGNFLPLRGCLPEEKITKDDHLRPRRLRRSSTARHASYSGQHSLPAVEFPVAICIPTSTPLIGAGDFLPLRGCLPEEKTTKDDHLRPRWLRRSSTARHASYSGQHLLVGVELPVAICLPTSTLLIGAGIFLL